MGAAKIGIYRVEHPDDRLGPYVSTIRSCRPAALRMFAEQLGARHMDEDHPSPDLDDGIGRGICSFEVCGFASLDQLHRWFTPDDLRDLQHLGFRIARYWVPFWRVTIGAAQVLFERP